VLYKQKQPIIYQKCNKSHTYAYRYITKMWMLPRSACNTATENKEVNMCILSCYNEIAPNEIVHTSYNVQCILKKD